MVSAKVTLFSTSSCIWCHKTRDFFKANKVRFKELDVGKSIKAAQEMVKKSGQQGVPVIDINGEVIVGYDERKFRKLLKLK